MWKSSRRQQARGEIRGSRAAARRTKKLLLMRSTSCRRAAGGVRPGRLAFQYEGSYLPITKLTCFCEEAGALPIIQLLKESLPRGQSTIDKASVFWINGDDDFALYDGLEALFYRTRGRWSRVRGRRLCGNQPVCRMQRNDVAAGSVSGENRHRHAIEQVSRRWRGGRRGGPGRTRRNLISTGRRRTPPTRSPRAVATRETTGQAEEDVDPFQRNLFAGAVEPRAPGTLAVVAGCVEINGRIHASPRRARWRGGARSPCTRSHLISPRWPGRPFGRPGRVASHVDGAARRLRGLFWVTWVPLGPGRFSSRRQALVPVSLGVGLAYGGHVRPRGLLR